MVVFKRQLLFKSFLIKSSLIQTLNYASMDFFFGFFILTLIIVVITVILQFVLNII